MLTNFVAGAIRYGSLLDMNVQQTSMKKEIGWKGVVTKNELVSDKSRLDRRHWPDRFHPELHSIHI